MDVARIRPARADEAESITDRAVRAARQDGYGESDIERLMPAFSANLALIAAGLILMAEDEEGAVIGDVGVRPTGIGGVMLLERIFVEPAIQRQGAGRRLFQAATELARRMAGSIILITANPPAASFYEHLGAIRLGETPYFALPHLILPILAFSIPPRETQTL